MSQDWQAPFHILREQFLAAVRESFRVNLALASFPDHAAYNVWYQHTVDADLLREVTSPMNREPGRRTHESAIGTVWGEAEGVQRFAALAKEAGNSLPFDFHPAARLFPSLNELSNLDPSPVTLWSEFLYVARSASFHTREDWPTPGCRIARLDGDPFLASATAIELFLLPPDAPHLDKYFQRMCAACPWMMNTAGGFPMVPPGILVSPFLRFDLGCALRTAVELEVALAARDSRGTVRGADDDVQEISATMVAAHVADRRVEAATDRLLCVLNPRMSRVSDWSRQLNFADASDEARQALRTLGLALADIRGEWEARGRELLAAGARHLWVGMRAGERGDVRELMSETHRLWGWPPDPHGEPGEYSGPRATLSDPRVIDQQRWQTRRAEYLNQLQAMTRHLNTLVDTIRLPAGGYFDIYCNDVKATRYSLPSVCPRAEPKPPLELRPDGDLLAEMECRFRDLGLITPDDSIHWVGRQDRRETRCGCELAPAAFYQSRPAEWRTLRDLRAAIVAMMKLVGPYVEGRGAGLVFPVQDRVTFETVAERVYGLAQSLGIAPPPIVSNPHVLRVHPHGPTGLPVHELVEGLVVSEADGRLWLSNWRAVRVGIDARLAQLDRVAQPDADADSVDTRDYPLDAPAGTPPPLRDAFESVARALFDAADFRREPPSGMILFRELAGGLASRATTADRHYTGAELQLQAVTDERGCAHQDALAAIRRVNDAAGHVILGSVPDHMAVAHLRQIPALDVAGLLRRMRQQVCRAAQSARTASYSAGTPPLTGVNLPGGSSHMGAAVISREGSTFNGADTAPANALIDESELAVLTELRDKHPLLLKNVDIQAATNLSKQKAGQVITDLIRKNLANRPNGRRKGVTATSEGLALVNRIRKSSADHP